MSGSGATDWLLRIWAGLGQHPFMASDSAAYSYSWLRDEIRRWESELARYGVGPGTVVALRGDYTPQIVAALMALIRCRAIVVPLSPSADAQATEFLDIAEVQMVVTPESPHRRVARRRNGQPANELLLRLIGQGHPGLVLFSSGSTGSSKAVLHDFSLLLEKFRKPRAAMVTLAFLMLDHIGGINTLLSVLSSGGTVVATAARNPDRICEVIERCRVELLPTSPTFLNLLLMSEAQRRHDLSSLKLITYGTESMPQSTLDAVRRTFPWVRVQQTYGLSELGILRSKSEHSGSLWVQIGGEGYETKVEQGTLRIRAKSAMLGYLNAPSPFDAEGWFDTQDVVETRGELVRFLGRRSEIVNVGGRKVYPAEVENVLLQMANVMDATVTGEAHPITGHVVVARVKLRHPEEPAVFRRQVRQFCRSQLEAFKIPAKIVMVDQDQFSSRFKKLRHSTAVTS